MLQGLNVPHKREKSQDFRQDTLPSISLLPSSSYYVKDLLPGEAPVLTSIIQDLRQAPNSSPPTPQTIQTALPAASPAHLP